VRCRFRFFLHLFSELGRKEEVLIGGLATYRNYDEAIKVMQRASAIPKNWKNISFHDEVRPFLFSQPPPLPTTYPLSIPQSLSPQLRLFKSLKLWSFYVDLEESIGTPETTKAVYDRLFELKIANAQVVINCAQFLEENEYWEESFKVRLPRLFLRLRS
jgi:pre-mRNA-splicing factor SYF1